MNPRRFDVRMELGRAELSEVLEESDSTLEDSCLRHNGMLV